MIYRNASTNAYVERMRAGATLLMGLYKFGFLNNLNIPKPVIAQVTKLIAIRDRGPGKKGIRNSPGIHITDSERAFLESMTKRETLSLLDRTEYDENEVCRLIQLDLLNAVFENGEWCIMCSSYGKFMFWRENPDGKIS